MIGGTSGVELIEFAFALISAATVYGLFTLIWRARHTRGRLEAELACCQNKHAPPVSEAAHTDG